MLAGMAKAVADVDAESNQGGFTTENANVTGFSTMHDSGTGNSICFTNEQRSCEDSTFGS
jgi:hypothetical protein